MTRSPDSQIPSGAGQPATGKRDDEAFNCRQEGEANLRAATQVNVVNPTSDQADSAGANPQLGWRRQQEQWRYIAPAAKFAERHLLRRRRPLVGLLLGFSSLRFGCVPFAVGRPVQNADRIGFEFDDELLREFPARVRD